MCVNRECERSLWWWTDWAWSAESAALLGFTEVYNELQLTVQLPGCINHCFGAFSIIGLFFTSTKALFWKPKSLTCFCVLCLSSSQMQRGQQSLTSGVAQSHHHPLRRKWEVVSGPPRHPDGKHSSHRVQHQDPECWRPRRRALRLLHPHKQEAKVH